MSSIRDRLLGPPKSIPSHPADQKEQLLSHQICFELDRLTATTSDLESSSLTIGFIFSSHQSFRSRLAAAADALGIFRKRVEKDQRFVLAAFAFMCIVATAVVARRLGFVWLMKSATSAVSRISFIGSPLSQGEQEL